MKINLRELAKTQIGSPNKDKAYWEQLQQKAKTGPIFSAHTIQFINDWPEELLPRDAKPYLLWYANLLTANDLRGNWNSLSADSKESMKSIKDYLDAHEWREFANWDELFKLSDAWHQELADKRNEKITISGDPIVYHFKDGHTIVKVKPENLEAEGEAMGHCVGGYCDKVYSGRANIYSLRSPEGKPLATIEISRNDEIEQIKGPKNKTPSGRHKVYILEWVDQLDLKNDPKESSDYLALLPVDKLVAMLKGAGVSIDAKIKVLQHLANGELKSLMANGELPEILLKLSKHPHHDIRKMIALNIMTPVEALDELMFDREAAVRMYLATNRSLSEEGFMTLARDNVPSVRAEIARNSSAPIKVLKHLVLDLESYVADAASNTLKKLLTAKPERQARAIRYLRKLAASNADPLIKINLRELAKTNPRPPEMSEKEYWGDLRDRAEDEGPIFDRSIIKFIHELPAEMMPQNTKQFVIWLGNQMKIAPIERPFGWKEDILPLIKDYLNVHELNESMDLVGLSNDALEWHLNMEADDSITIKGDKVVYAFQDGFKIVEVSLKNLKDEGCAMGHCVGKGGYHDAVKKGTTKIYSLRDPSGGPKATIEMNFDEDGSVINQIRGPNNSTPDDTFKPYLKEWVSSIGKDTSTNSDYLAILSFDELFDRIKSDSSPREREKIFGAMLSAETLSENNFEEMFEGKIIESRDLRSPQICELLRAELLTFGISETIQKYWPGKYFPFVDLLTQQTKYEQGFLDIVVNTVIANLTNHFNGVGPGFYTQAQSLGSSVLRHAPLTRAHQIKFIQAFTSLRTFEQPYVEMFRYLCRNPHFHTPFLDEIADINEDYAKLVRSIKSE